MSENTAEEEKMEITEDELKELIDERVEKRLKEEKQKQRKTSDKEKVSRRDFLKKLGAGALGLGALSLPSVSAFDVRADSFDVFTGTGENDLTKYLGVSQGGPVNIQNTNLDLNNQNLQNVNQLNGQNVDNLGFSGNYNDLTNRGHGNSDHDTNFLAQSNYNPVSDVESGTLTGPLSFADESREKINLYSSDYGFGVESSTLTLYSNQNIRFREGGYSGQNSAELDLTNQSMTIGGDTVATRNWVNNNAGGDKITGTKNKSINSGSQYLTPNAGNRWIVTYISGEGGGGSFPSPATVRLYYDDGTTKEWETDDGGFSAQMPPNDSALVEQVYLRVGDYAQNAGFRAIEVQK